MSTQFDERIALLREHLEKLQSQRDRLLKEMDEMEERFEATEKLYRQYLPLILDMLIQENSEFGKACKELAACIKGGSRPAKLSYVFDKVKTAVLKEEAGTQNMRRKKGVLAGLFRSSSDQYVAACKEDYNEVVNQLRSTMDNAYSTRLNAIARSILNAGDVKDLTDIREGVFDLIFRYINDTHADRAKVNAFVRDIVTQILEIENRMDASHDHAERMYESDTGFETLLSGEMKEMKASADVAVNLDDLKVEISQRLSSIDSALQKKQMAHRAIRQATVKNHESFKSGFALLKKELNEATRYTEELEEKLNRDQLTGAYNRRAYDQKIEEELARSKRYGRPLSLLLMDVDHFKSINDTYGHAIGDKCLREIIQRSLPLLRTNDMLARYGGEEFAVIMPETDIKGASKAADKIRAHIEKIIFVYKSEKVQVTVSIGVSQVMESDAAPKDLFERADIAVYKAKKNGRNRIEPH